MKCKICGKEATIHAFGMPLCKDDFVRLFERRVERILKKYKMKDKKIAIALSGGKDSMVVLHYLVTHDYNVFGYFIDLGIPPVSEISKNIVMKSCKEYSIPLVITDLRKEYGFTVADFRGKSCSICSTIKRYLINKVPREEGAEVVATGHNMDDFMEFFFKNMLGKNYVWNRNMVPYLPSEHPKLLPRIRPLYLVGDMETKLYADIIGIRYSPEKCPFAKFSGWKDIFYDIERKKRNFRHEMIRSIWEMAEFFPEYDVELKECKICGEPTSREICSFCTLKNKIK